MKRILFYFSVCLAIILIIARAQAVIYYSKSAMQLCYELIIPTLFPFFICSGLLIYSGFGTVLAHLSQGVMRPVFNVAPAGAAAFVLGIISGFPLGAVTVCQLYKCNALSKSEAERLLAFCNNSGPLFIIGSVGAAIYGKLSYGIILYCIHILSSVLVGIIFRFWHRDKHNSPPMRLQTQSLPLTMVFSKALSNASRNILTVCFTIIFFSALSRAVLDLLPLSPLLDALVSGLCEFSTGTLKTSMLGYPLYEKLVLTSFIVAFSGISVHIQVMAVTADSGLSLMPYILGKLLHGSIAAAITAALLYFFPISAAVFSGDGAVMSISCILASLFIFISIAITFILWCCCRISSRDD